MNAAMAYDQLRGLRREAAVLGSVGALAGWDQETYMPRGGAGARAEQRAMVATLVHQRLTSPRVGELLAQCEAALPMLGPADGAVARNLREMRRDYTLATRVPADLVAELARTTSRAQEVWKEARKASDFALFAPMLERVVGLTRRRAECLGVPPGGELYDPLLDEYEPGMTAAEVEAIFAPLRTRLSALIATLADGKPPSTRITTRKVKAERQHALGLALLEAIGFDLGAGRLDTTTHPFCSGLGPGDVRLTTRYRDERWTDALFGTLHEAGHGLYEQGLPIHPPTAGEDGDEFGHYGEPLGEAVSLGIHESQSRMWENFVGRSLAFWRWATPRVRKHFGGKFEDVKAKEIYQAVNTATPSFIRVEADEATYNLHIMLRFEIERALVRGDLAVRDVPGAWNERFASYLGLEVPSDARGCLQDVHWSGGLIGYFPTYTLGNLYAAQLWEAASASIGDLEGEIAKGRFEPLLSWLRTNIHGHGRQYRAWELCERVTGAPLSADPLLRHLEGKLRPIYRV